VRRKIGYLPELNPLYMDMNVMESLEFSARLQGLKNEDLRQRMKMMFDVCGLANVRHKEVSELSKGYRQRLGLAQALVHDPDVLILDEPTSGLDPNQIVEIRNLIKKIGLAKTVILSTHILSEVQATCDRVIIINEGKIVADGTTSQLAEQFRASEIVSIELKATVGDAMVEIFPVLQNLEGVESVEFGTSDGDIHKFNLRSSKGTDIRASLYKLVQEKNWMILEMHRKVTSLEEVFHKLTKTGIEN
jgi:ABC-2 type transport system ATP-binding protein